MSFPVEYELMAKNFSVTLVASDKARADGQIVVAPIALAERAFIRRALEARERIDAAGHPPSSRSSWRS